MLLNMLRRVKRDAGLASAFTRMCRPRRHLPSWCLRSLFEETGTARGIYLRLPSQCLHSYTTTGSIRSNEAHKSHTEMVFSHSFALVSL